MTVKELRALLPVLKEADKPLANAVATALVGRWDDEEIPLSEAADARLRAVVARRLGLEAA